MEKPNILITGSNGVLGNAFKRNKQYFKEFNLVFSSGREYDLTDPIACESLFDIANPDYVFHLAAKSGGIGLSNNYQATLFRDNSLMALNIADNCLRKNVKKCIFTLSVGMYPENAILPIKEDYNLLGKPHSSSTGYAYSKALIEPLIKTYCSQYGVNFIGLVPNGIFGPEDNFDPNHSAMLPSLIRKAFFAKKNNSSLEVWGDGTPLRQYTFVDDYVRIYKWCLDNFNNPEIINVGTSEEVSIANIAELVCKGFNLNLDNIEFQKNKPNGIFRRPMDNTKFITKSNFKFTSLEEGINKTCSWFSENYNLINSESKL